MNDEAFAEDLRRRAENRAHLCVSRETYQRYITILKPSSRFRVRAIAEHGYKTIQLFFVKQKKLCAFDIPIIVGFEYGWLLALNGDYEAYSGERRI